ncbi:thermonuclease family protein [Roseibacterium sp. SDUM158017]|uniref:thermonuclease family protein n=1 Tax=Roseicyclus salinarum TaxID=3036773 RepID=UPI00241555CE|nr:thermonuclease family protein [Roseibacterium sp. SDUM158017]MDG4647670.1 thermonuclease family protein [Roseibacterium sp. SDUM158017]
MPFLRLAPVLALLLALLVASCYAVGPQNNVQGHGAAIPECDVTYVIDGDTVEMICVGLGEIRARLAGYDAPEVFSPACPREARLGREATERLSALLDAASSVEPRFDGMDRYGRHIVRMDIDGRDVARTMVAEDLAVPFPSGSRPDWCGGRG